MKNLLDYIFLLLAVKPYCYETVHDVKVSRCNQVEVKVFVSMTYFIESNTYFVAFAFTRIHHPSSVVVHKQIYLLTKYFLHEYELEISGCMSMWIHTQCFHVIF